MNILIMAGGRGSRLSNPNKPLLTVCGKPMIQSIVDSVSGLGKIYVACTDMHREVINWALKNGVNYVITKGRGYAEDLLEALSIIGTPALILPSDLPFINRELIIRFLRVTAYLRMPMVTLINTKNNELEYTGISYIRSTALINGVIPWVNVIVKEPITLMNVNTQGDLNLAKTLCRAFQQA